MVSNMDLDVKCDIMMQELIDVTSLIILVIIYTYR